MCAGDPYDLEVLPRIRSVAPRVGSLAGGTDVTIVGVGFGSDREDLHVTVAGVECSVTHITPTAVHCRVQPLAAATADGTTAEYGEAIPPQAPTIQAALGADLASFPGERGVRWQWLSSGGATGSALLPEFSAPFGWADIAGDGTATQLEGWFDSPIDSEAIFALPDNVAARLRWSGSEAVGPVETLASVSVPRVCTCEARARSY